MTTFMKTTYDDGWISVEDRKPTKEECREEIWNYEEGSGFIGLRSFLSGFATHWMPAHIPTPPKLAQTQFNKDQEALRMWSGKDCGYSTIHGAAWFAALAYRDEQNAIDLGNMHYYPIMTYDDDLESFENLRRRCGLDK